MGFAEAAEVGLGLELEAAAIAAALPALDRLPPPIGLSVNASPDLIASGALRRLLLGCDLRRLVVEVTEHEAAQEPERLAWELDPLRDRGLHDAGAGHSGLQQILRLRPDLIKLDISLTRNVDTDHARACLAEAMAAFARRTCAILVAEGIETDEELVALRRLGVRRGQGYLLGRPTASTEVLAAFDGHGPARRAG